MVTISLVACLDIEGRDGRDGRNPEKCASGENGQKLHDERESLADYTGVKSAESVQVVEPGRSFIPAVLFIRRLLLLFVGCRPRGDHKDEVIATPKLYPKIPS